MANYSGTSADLRSVMDLRSLLREFELVSGVHIIEIITLYDPYILERIYCISKSSVNCRYKGQFAGMKTIVAHKLTKGVSRSKSEVYS